jgi:hypothetical protein
MLETLELIKRTIPTNSASPPAEVFGIIRQVFAGSLRGQVARSSLRQSRSKILAPG